MAIAIREYLGYEGFHVEWNVQEKSKNSLVESLNDTISPDSLMVDIEGIHVGPTRNYTWYTKEALEGSVPSWTKPYLRPLIMHHNEKDGKIIGRIKFATYTENNTRSGTGALIFTSNVPDADGKEQIQDGRLKTVSIGVIVHDCRCSICGHNIAEDGECEHERGVTYEDKKCYWIIHAMEAKELSYVIVPSDIYAHNIRVYKPTKADMNMAANYESKGVLNVAENNNVVKDPVETIESTIVDENGQKNEEVKDQTPELEALKKENEELKAKNSDLTKENEELKNEKEETEKSHKEVKDELDSTKVLLSQAQKSVDEVKDTLTTKENELNTERSLKETLENQIIELKSESKTNLIENVMLLRKTLGKSIGVKEDLEGRTEESLKDAIKDLKEELEDPTDVNKITKATNPSIVEDHEDKSNVDKEKKAGNIDLAEGLENVFSAILRSKGNNY